MHLGKVELVILSLVLCCFASGKALKVGDECQTTVDCVEGGLGELSECPFGKRCRCIPTEGVANPDETLCLPIVNEIGGACEVTKQCTVGKPGFWSTCNAQVCQCTPDAVSAEGEHTCYRKATLVGDSCDIMLQCSNIDTITTCSPPGNTRGCAPDTLAARNVTRRRLEVRQNECVEEVQCTEGSCQCNEGFQFYSSRCYKPAALGEDCCVSEECKIGVVSEFVTCSESGVCECSSGAIQVDQTCEQRTDGGALHLAPSFASILLFLLGFLFN